MTDDREAADKQEAALEMAGGEGKCPRCGAPRPDLSAPCVKCGAPPLGPASPAPTPGMPEGRRSVIDAIMHVRSADLEPYIGLRYLSKLFKVMAIIIGLLLIAEVITGLATQGQAAIPTLLGEASKLLVLAGLLWGIGDLAILLIDIGHDVRATRILLGRQAAHHLQDHHTSGGARPPGRNTVERRAER